jgi:peptide/nickel transport system permease protein
MHKYILRRILLLVPVLLGVTFVVFAIMALTPGDPGTLILGQNASEEAIRQINDQLGYNDPLLVKYFRYVLNAVRGDFGSSYRSQKPVFQEIFLRFPTTLKLAIGATILAVLIGIPIGIISAVKQYSLLDIVTTVTAIFLASVPQFWLGLMMILFFALRMGILPAIGVDSYKGYIMPMFTLSLPVAASILRLTRTAMLEVIRQDYIRTARAKGAEELTIILRHALKNTLLPIITIVGLNFGYLLGGTVLVEAIFGIPGVGTLTITSIRMKDMPQTTASIIFLSSTYCVILLAVDILYAYVDPRLRARFAK